MSKINPECTVLGMNSFDGSGLTVRAYLAGQTIIGLLASDGINPRWVGQDVSPDFQRGGGKWQNPSGVAQQAVEIADAIIKTLNEGPRVEESVPSLVDERMAIIEEIMKLKGKEAVNSYWFRGHSNACDAIIEMIRLRSK